MSDHQAHHQAATDAPPPQSSTATAEVASALKETLERTGDLDDVRARLRAAVLRNLNASLPAASSNNDSSSPPDAPIETMLINELVADYLACSGYDQTLSVFAVEAQTGGGGRLGEQFIRAELGLSRPGVSSPLALLYEIVEAMKAWKTRRAGP
ncbi:hypothetical protein ACHAXT_006135 [Thalassiosira profunda]